MTVRDDSDSEDDSELVCYVPVPQGTGPWTMMDGVAKTKNEPDAGLEPATSRLRACHSTN
jgi:hypothetical protein